MDEKYQDLLDDILRFTARRRLLRQIDVANYLGLDVHTVRKKYGIGRDGILATEFARMLCRRA